MLTDFGSNNNMPNLDEQSTPKITSESYTDSIQSRPETRLNNSMID